MSDHTRGEHPKLYQIHPIDDIEPRELHHHRRFLRGEGA
jgi:hypothetical protein